MGAYLGRKAMGFALNRPDGLMTPDRGEKLRGRGMGSQGEREAMPGGISRRASSFLRDGLPKGKENCWAT